MEATYGSLPFTEAIEFLKQKVPMPSSRWEDFTGGMHSRAFVVAGAMKSELLTDLFEAVQKGIDGKGTIADFRKTFDETVARNGWSYKGSRAWRTNTIYYTNLSVAYSAGREKQMADPDFRSIYKYARYRTMDDGRVRPLHRSWGTVILPLDDPWWDDHTPPNGWGCRCWKEPVSGPEYNELSKSDRFRTEAPDDGEYEWNNPSTGETEMVPNGIDPGWNYNPGTAAWGKFQSEKTMAEWENTGEERWAKLTKGDYGTNNRPARIPLDSPPSYPAAPVKDRAQLRTVIESAIGGPEKVFTFNNKGFRMDYLVNAEALARHIGIERAPYMPWIESTVRNPFEIWASFERNLDTGRVRLRERFIKGFNARKKAMLAVFQAVEGKLESWTVIPTDDLKYVNRQRAGKLLYGRD